LENTVIPTPIPISKQTPVKRKKKRKIASTGHSTPVSSSTASVSSASHVSNATTKHGEKEAKQQQQQPAATNSSAAASTPAITNKQNQMEEPKTSEPATKPTTPVSSSKSYNLPPIPQLRNTPTTTQTQKKKKKTFQDQILHTMVLSCKPYTLKTLTASARSGEAAVNSVLLSLIDKQLVMKKEFIGKKTTKVLYWANQQKSMEVEGGASNEEISEANSVLNQLQHMDQNVERELSNVTKEPTNEELTQKVTQMEQEVRDLQKRIQEAKNCTSQSDPSSSSSSLLPKQPQRPGTLKYNQIRNPLPPTKKQKTPLQLKKEFNVMRLEWKKRKLSCMDFVDNIAEAMEKKNKDVMGSKILDLDTDEMNGCVLPPPKELK